ncbi:MAG: F0F1 ATP synthase subunit B [Gemmobacter sp.]
MRLLITLALALGAVPAAAASGPFLSLRNSDFVVLIAFLVFVGVLVYFKVPGLLGGLLDKRAAGIRTEIETARALRDEAKALLASYERKSREVKDQAERIVASAREDAMTAAEAAKEEIRRNIARRLKAAEDQIAAAEADAIRAVREQAIAVAVAAAGDVLARQMTAKAAGALIDDGIAEVGARLH